MKKELLIKTPLIFDDNMKYYIGVDLVVENKQEIFNYVVISTYKDRDKLIVIDSGTMIDPIGKSKFKVYCEELKEYFNSSIYWDQKWV